jgi:uncharacterized HhH-GPD family protein
MADVAVRDVRRLEPFNHRWSDGAEAFEGGWAYTAEVGGGPRAIRHGVGARQAFGRVRVRTVTWIGGEAEVEGVEADDYPVSQALLSRLRRCGRALARTMSQVPAGYAPLPIVDHARELEAPYSPACLAVKLREDDLAGWALHAWLRSQVPRGESLSARRPGTGTLRPVPLPPPPAPDAGAAGAALLAHAGALAAALGGGTFRLTQDPAANALVHGDAFAFLVAVIADMGIRADRAWALPYLLGRRLGDLSPSLLRQDQDAIQAAVQQPPRLHRFASLLSDWLAQAAGIVVERYDGRADRLWSDQPTPMELRRRLEVFPGVGPKKAAMAVEVLARDLRVPLRPVTANDVTYDAHLRRVFLRTGLARQNEASHMVSVVRELYPNRPGALDVPAWDIGRRWCRPTGPDCPACPLNTACARLIRAGSRVRNS